MLLYLEGVEIMSEQGSDEGKLELTEEAASASLTVQHSAAPPLIPGGWRGRGRFGLRHTRYSGQYPGPIGRIGTKPELIPT